MKLTSLSLAAAIALAASTAGAETPHRLHVELDPLPFVLGGYGGQIGVRPAPLPRWRFAVASFSLDVPDRVAELGGNDGFSLRVRPSIAGYALYYPSEGRGGWAFGGSLRYLRFRYTRADTPGESADVGQASFEVIAGYKLHPVSTGWARGFFAQPWLTVARRLVTRGDAVVGSRTYDPLPLDVFFTVNLGWELEIL